MIICHKSSHNKKINHKDHKEKPTDQREINKSSFGECSVKLKIKESYNSTFRQAKREKSLRAENY